jgi:hypothetical protein
MKRCPECDSIFPDTDQFCELDGTTLVADYSDSNAAVGDRIQDIREVLGIDSRDALNRHRQNWKPLAIVAVAGVAIGMVLFLVYQRVTREIPGQSSNESASNVAVTQQQIPLLPLRPSPFASASPSAEPSPSPSAMPSPSVQAESARVELSTSPVSTGGSEQTRRGQVTIRLTNGTTVEADEVWETGEGIWYRRRGVLTLLERDQVKAIEKPSPASSPAVTPTSSPIASP